MIVCRTGTEYIYILAPNYLRRGGRWQRKGRRRRKGRSDGFTVRPDFGSNMTRNTFLIGPQLKRNIAAEFIHESGGRGVSWEITPHQKAWNSFRNTTFVHTQRQSNKTPAVRRNNCKIYWIKRSAAERTQSERMKGMRVVCGAVQASWRLIMKLLTRFWGCRCQWCCQRVLDFPMHITGWQLRLSLALAPSSLSVDKGLTWKTL